MASSRTLSLAGLGVLAAGVLIYFAAFSDSSTEAPSTIPSAPAVSAGTQAPDEAGPAVVSQAPEITRRSVEGPAVSAVNGGLEGLVTDPQGQPLPGTRVEIVKAPLLGLPLPTGFADPAESKSYSATSGTDGRYKIVAPAGDGWKLVAVHPDFARVEHLNVPTSSDRFFPVDIQMRRGTRVYGRITEQNQPNIPIVGAIVTLDPAPTTAGFNRSSDVPREVTAGNSGEFKFENVRAGLHSILVQAPGFGTFLGQTHIGEDETHRFDASLRPGTAISGRVIDSNGHGVPNARVMATVGGIAGSYGEAISNEIGDFVVRDLAENRYYVTATAAGLGEGKAEPQPVASGTVDVQIRLAPRCAVQGIVLEKGTGRPVTGFTVTLRRSMPNAVSFPFAGGPYTYESKDGTFEVAGIDPQFPYVLEVTSPGYAVSRSDPFTAQPGQVTHGIEIRMPMGGTIVGRLVDARNGKPVVGAVVTSKMNNWRDMSGVPLLGPLVSSYQRSMAEQSGTSDEDGAFRLEHVEEGAVQIVATHPELLTLYQTDVLVREGGSTDVGTLRLKVGSAIYGTVYNGDGTPAVNSEVTIRSSAPIVAGRPMLTKKIRTDAKGKYLAKSLPAGDYMVTAAPPSPGDAPPSPFVAMVTSQKTRRDVSLIEGADQELDIYLPSN